MQFGPVAKGKIKDDEFTSNARLVSGLQGFRNLSRLCFALPRGRVTAFKRELPASGHLLFPTVEDLNIPYDGHYILTQCPKVHRLTMYCHRWVRASSGTEKDQKTSETFRAEMVRLGKTLKKCEFASPKIRTLGLEFSYKRILPSMLRGK
jgi:hypothetical protein